MPAQPGTLCQYHEQGDDVLWVHLEGIVNRNQLGLTLEVTVRYGDAILGKAAGWRSVETTWAP
jgi:hypothetical protein